MGETLAKPRRKAKAPAPAFSAGPKSRALIAAEAPYIAPGLQTIATLSGLALERGEGCRLFDADGREYLDFVAGIGVASLGHAHPKYARALSEQVSRLSVGSFTTARRASFAKTLSSVTPKGLSRVQLYSSGAEAVEAALRLAKSKTKGHEVVGFWGGFHGKTGGVLGLLGDTSFKHGLGPLSPGLYLSPFPNPARCPLRAEGPHDCAAHCLEFLREKIRRETSNALCAVIVEPIQGTAGNVIPPPGFLRGVKEVAREFGALLISDEMICGFGRTGRMFGCEHDGVVPDVMTIGKGMAGGFPVSGIVTSDEVSQAKPFANPSGSSSSYGGNPLAAAAADAALSIILEERLVDNAREVGALLLKRLSELPSRCPWVGGVRGRGLMLGIDLVLDRKTKAPLPGELCREIFFEALGRGLLTMAYNPGLRIYPPLIVSKAEALRGADILEASISAVHRRRSS